MGKYEFLTPKLTREEAVREYVAGGSSTKIAKKYGVSSYSILNWVRMAGHAVRKQGTDAATKAAIVRAYLAGDNSHAAGEKFGVSAFTVLKCVAAAGHQIRRSGPQGVPFPFSMSTSSTGKDSYVRRYLHPDYWLFPYGNKVSGSSNSKSMLEHRRVMAESLGRPLEGHETVHHLNGDRSDNRIENLELHGGHHGHCRKYICVVCGGVERVDGVVCASCRGTNWKAAPLV